MSIETLGSVTNRDQNTVFFRNHAVGVELDAFEYIAGEVLPHELLSLVVVRQSQLSTAIVTL